MKVLIILNVIYLFSISTGTPVDRISGGVEGDIGDYPFAASLLSNQGDGAYRQVCGGTIVSASAILSAASCFVTINETHPVEWWRARLGSTYANRQGLVYILRRITVHPDYNGTAVTNDLAVVRTTLDITFGPTIQPAYIAGGAYNLANNQAVWAIGWGATSNIISDGSEELQHVQVWVVDQQTCVNRYRELGYTVTDSMLCAGWLDVGIRGQCQGDTGSPLLHNGVLVGVYSWTKGCGASRHPNINTRVSSYTRWIESTAVAA